MSIFALRGAIVALALSGPAALAQVQLKLSRTTLMSGSRCQLTAARTDGRTPHWVWGPPEAAIVTEHDGRVFFTAPAVTVPTLRTIVITDTAVNPPQSRSKEICVIPLIPGMPPELAEDILPGVMGQDWTGAPAMTLFAGDADDDFWKKGRPFTAINNFRLLEDDPAMGSSNGRWLVADTWGLKELARDGGHAPIRSLLDGRIRNLAVRPRGSFATNPYHVIFTLSNDGTYDHAVYALAADGSYHIVAGGGLLTELAYKDGQGQHARFGIISALEMAPDGTIYVADRSYGVIRRIDTTGHVTTFAGSAREYRRSNQHRDGPATQALFRSLGGMVLDPLHGDLYVIDGGGIRVITPAGVVTTILGDVMQDVIGHQWMVDQVIPPGATPCLDSPSEVQIHGRNLFITDVCGVRVFNLDTRLLQNLTVPRPEHDHLGDLLCFNPSTRNPASLRKAYHLAVTPDGACLVGLPHGLARLDVRLLTQPTGTAEDRAENEGETKDSHPPSPPGPPAATVLYTLPASLPEVGPEASVRRLDRPDGSFELTAVSRTGEITHWAWTSSAGTCVEAGLANIVRFTPPADARSGSVFRITARGTATTRSASSTWVGPSAHIDITLP
jgi:hypothetical protein